MDIFLFVYLAGYVFWAVFALSTDDTFYVKVLSITSGIILWPYFLYRVFIWFVDEMKYHNWRNNQ